MKIEGLGTVNMNHHHHIISSSVYFLLYVENYLNTGNNHMRTQKKIKIKSNFNLMVQDEMLR